MELSTSARPSSLLRPLLRLAIGGVLLPAALEAPAYSQTISFTTTRVPTSTTPGYPDPIDIRSDTAVTGMNDTGQFVGTFGERNATIWGMPHAFLYGSTGYGQLSAPGSYGRDPTGQYRLGQIDGPLYADPNYHYLDLAPAPGSDFNSLATVPYAINNAGLVVGKITSDQFGDSPSQGFIYNSVTGGLTTFTVPGSTSTVATGVNNLGQIVGNFTAADGSNHGFLANGQTYTVINDPAGEGGDQGTFLGGINDHGDISGWVQDYARRVDTGFIYKNGAFTNFNVDGNSTYSSGINNADQIVGWIGVSGKRVGFVYQNGISTILDLAGSASGDSTYAYTINNSGVIGGTVGIDGGLGFFATVSAVPEAPPAFMLLLGVLGLGLARDRIRPPLDRPLWRPGSKVGSRLPMI